MSDIISRDCMSQAYGKTTYLITSFRRVLRGTEGAVSLEGTAAGIVASLLFALLALAFGQVQDQCSSLYATSLLMFASHMLRNTLCIVQINARSCGIVVVASTVANVFESYLGASVQAQQEWLTNDVVNMIQISVAATLAICLQQSLL